ncbi:434_t:CDS:2, partial [Dentiscutata erythropus]
LFIIGASELFVLKSCEFLVALALHHWSLRTVLKSCGFLVILTLCRFQ